MNDEMKGKSGKVKVMYVRSDDDSDKRIRRQPWYWKRKCPNRDYGGRRPARDDKQSQPRDRKWEESPWRTVSRAPGDETPEKADHGSISGKSFIDPEVLRRQRAEETRVYGENACQALFQSRPEAIVRAWFIRECGTRLGETVGWQQNPCAYHVVDEAELTKASGTEHHGGVCFLIKKRNGTTVQQWVSQAGAQDCVLALENESNPATCRRDAQLRAPVKCCGAGCGTAGVGCGYPHQKVRRIHQPTSSLATTLLTACWMISSGSGCSGITSSEQGETLFKPIASEKQCSISNMKGYRMPHAIRTICA
ncbi:Methyltransferase [Escherichia coli]|nr:Methyltransferase [Escherichia coli]